MKKILTYEDLINCSINELNLLDTKFYTDLELTNLFLLIDKISNKIDKYEQLLIDNGYHDKLNKDNNLSLNDLCLYYENITREF